MGYTVPDQSGRLAVVTGANRGIGKEAAARLAEAGARVVLAVRSPERGEQARRDLIDRVPDADLHVRHVDLADLTSVRRFADELLAGTHPVEVLVNNAGVMAVPDLQLTADGFELQMAANVLGPLALTNLLLPSMLAAAQPRVVFMSSTAAWTGRVDPDQFAAPRRYNPMRVYSTTKLADLLLARHLARVAEDRGWSLRSVAAHPGFTRTALFTSGASLGREEGRSIPRPIERLVRWQEVPEGVASQLVAATAPDAENGSYWGPSGFLQMAGAPRRVRAPRAAADRELAARTWSAAERLTGTRLPFASHPRNLEGT